VHSQMVWFSRLRWLLRCCLCFYFSLSKCHLFCFNNTSLLVYKDTFSSSS
jgi:hypothetical protein